MKVAALQMVSTPRLNDNLVSAARLIKQASQAGAELCVLPEYFCMMGMRESDKLTIQEPLGQGEIQQFLSNQAALHGITLAGGTLPLCSDDPARPRNSTLVYGGQGQLLARYDKIHLFSFHKGREAYNEGASLQAGSAPVTFEVEDLQRKPWQVGLSICYDLRFAELYRLLASDILLIPAAFTHTTGQAHWEILLRARAIENQAYVIAAAQAGHHENGRQTWGQSMIISPWGEVLSQQTEGEGVVLADLDYAYLQHVRTILPVRRHRVLA